MSFISYISENRSWIIELSLQHIELSILTVLAAAFLAVPIGILATRDRRIAFVSMNLANFGQSIPTFGVIGLMIPLFGIGFKPAIIALLLLAFLPILRNTCAGINAADPAVIEAGRGMGMTQKQILFMIELPLAVPVIFAGIRTATVMTISTATLAALIGAGGLGELVFRGIEMYDSRILLAGGICIAVMAIAADQIMGVVEKLLSSGGGKEAADVF